MILLIASVLRATEASLYQQYETCHQHANKSSLRIYRPCQSASCRWQTRKFCRSYKKRTQRPFHRREKERESLMILTARSKKRKMNGATEMKKLVLHAARLSSAIFQNIHFIGNAAQKLKIALTNDIITLTMKNIIPIFQTGSSCLGGKSIFSLAYIINCNSLNLIQ